MDPKTTWTTTDYAIAVVLGVAALYGVTYWVAQGARCERSRSKFLQALMHEDDLLASTARYEGEGCAWVQQGI